MKKTLLLAPVLFSLLALPLIVAAQTETVPDDIEFMDVLERILNWLFSILLVVAAIAIVVAAYFFVTAQGDPERVGKARQFVIYAMVGVLVGFMAKGLVELVRSIVGA